MESPALSTNHNLCLKVSGTNRDRSSLVQRAIVPRYPSHVEYCFIDRAPDVLYKLWTIEYLNPHVAAVPDRQHRRDTNVVATYHQ